MVPGECYTFNLRKIKDNFISTLRRVIIIKTAFIKRKKRNLNLAPFESFIRIFDVQNLNIY